MSANDGTAAGLVEFLDWAESKGELPKATVANWRGAAKNVLDIEEQWEALDLHTLDLDAFLLRFENLRRTRYKVDSLNAYKGRFRKGVEAYRAWLANPGGSEWKAIAAARPTGSPTAARASKTSGKGSGSHARPNPPANAPVTPSAAGVIDYTVPLRPGVYARLGLPENLTTKDAARLTAFVQSLAFEEQPALPVGSTGAA